MDVWSLTVIFELL